MSTEASVYVHNKKGENDLAKDRTMEDVILEKISADLKFGECIKATYNTKYGTFVWTPEVVGGSIQSVFDYGKEKNDTN